MMRLPESGPPKTLKVFSVFRLSLISQFISFGQLLELYNMHEIFETFSGANFVLCRFTSHTNGCELNYLSFATQKILLVQDNTISKDEAQEATKPRLWV